MTMSDRYRRWFTYEQDAHARVLASLRTVPESHRGEEPFRKAVELFAHIISARQFWLHRFGVTDKRPEELFPKQVTLDDLGARMEETYAAWSAYFEGLDDAELDRMLDYRATEGHRYRNRIEDILTQLFGHAWYHRGQVASLVKDCGGKPAATDFVFWARERLDRE